MRAVAARASECMEMEGSLRELGDDPALVEGEEVALLRSSDARRWFARFSPVSDLLSPDSVSPDVWRLAELKRRRGEDVGPVRRPETRDVQLGAGVRSGVKDVKGRIRSL